jgi:TPR repeat protein
MNARYQLGRLYLSGDVPVNYDMAFNFTSLAAQQGHARAQYNLGTMYSLGLGVPINGPESALWYARAASQGVRMGNPGLRIVPLPADFSPTETFFKRLLTYCVGSPIQ